MKTRIVLLLLSTLLGACATQEFDPSRDGGVLWVKHSAEYQAITQQVYTAATSDLERFRDDPGWSALPEQTDAGSLPPAVILDVDETVVSNVDFQLTYEPPFENWKLDKWTSENPATPIRGVREFVAAARAAGVTVFFVTNRPCERIEGDDDPCPPKTHTLEDIAEVGITTDGEHLFLSQEQGWNREKSTRREHVAKTHRVIMLIGDDLGDFIPCVRTKAYEPCTTTADAADRLALMEKHADRWGNGWYILPNPMHGSWTPVLPR